MPPTPLDPGSLSNPYIQSAGSVLPIGARIRLPSQARIARNGEPHTFGSRDF